MYFLTSVIIYDVNTIIVGTNSNKYLISYNLGYSWTIADIKSPIVQLIKNNNIIYALCQDGNLYNLYVLPPLTYNIYDNNNLLQTDLFKTNTNFTILNNLITKPYNLYSTFTSTNPSFLPITTNNLNINVNQSLVLYTISSTVNINSTRIYFNYNLPLIYDYTTHFVKINTTNVLNSGIKKVRMTNQTLGYACGLNGTVSRTTDGGITWSNLTLNIDISSVLIDVYGYDISNIITIGGKYMYKTLNGGITWSFATAFEGNVGSCMSFIYKRGFVATNVFKIYETVNFGDTWYGRTISLLPIITIYMLSMKFITYTSTSNISWSYDGYNYTNGLTGATVVYPFSPTTGLAISSTGTNVYYIYNNFISYITVLTAPLGILFTDVTMVNDDIMLVTTNTNIYYVSYNRGTTWIINKLISPIISMQNIGHGIYGIGYDDNIYFLQTGLGLSTIKINNQLTSTYINSAQYNKTINLTDNSIISIQNQTISSNILFLTISDYYSIYSANNINYSNQMQILKTTNINGFLNSNLFFTKVNTQTINTCPTNLKVYDISSIYVFNYNGYMSKSIDRGYTWSDISLNSQIFLGSSNAGFDIVDNNTYVIFGTSRTGSTTRVLRTTDAGKSWFDGSGIALTCTAMAFSNNVGYLGTSTGGLLKTTNNGATWSLLFTLNNAAGYVYKIKIISPTLLFFGHTIGYLYTDGSSATYSQSLISVPVYYIANYDTNIIFFASYSAVYKSINAGVTNSIILTVPVGYITSMCVVSNYLILTLNTNYYYVSFDFGTTWSYFSFETSFINMIEFNFSLYGLSINGDLYNCNVLPTESINITDNGVIVPYATYPTINLTISGNQKLYNFTITTTNINNKNQKIQYIDILNLPKYSSIIPVTTYTNMSINQNSYDVNVTAFYQELQTTNNILNIYFYDTNNGIATSFTSGIFVTQNGGITWVYKQSNLSSLITFGIIVQLNNILCTTNDGTILQSTDFGTSWTIIYLSYKSYLTNMYFLNSTFGAYCGYTNNIYITNNSGLTFTQSITNTSSYFNKVFITPSSTIYAIGTNNTIIKSTNIGSTWINISTTNLIQTFYDIYMFNENIGFVVGSDGYILKTTDGFNTFILTKLTTYTLKTILFYDINTILVGGYNGVLFLSTDIGNTWSQIGSGTKNNINCLNKINSIIRFGFNGGICSLNYSANQIYSIFGTVELFTNSIYNLNSIYAWYEPNNVSLSNNSIIGWNSINRTNNFTITNGSITQVSYNKQKMLSFNTVSSYISLPTGVNIGGFICVVNFRSAGYLFGMASYSNIGERTICNGGTLNINDVQYGVGGLVAINGNTVYNYDISQNYLSPMNNSNSYMIVYVKFSNSITNMIFTPSIGSNYQNSGFTGLIGDFILLNQNHTQNDRLIIENYLTNKWFNINLNSNIINNTNFTNPITNTSCQSVFTPISNIYYSSISISSIIIIKPNLYIYGQPKYYDTTSSVILSLSGVLNNNVTIAYYNAYYLNSDAGNDNIIYYNNLILTGLTDNYVLPNQSGLTVGNILQKPIIINFVFNDKIYDNNTNVTLSNYIISQPNIDIQIDKIVTMLRNVNVGYQIVDISNILIIGNNNYICNKQISYINIFPKLLTPINTTIYYSNNLNSVVTLSGLIPNDIYYLSSSLLPYNDINIFTITISNLVNDNPVPDTVFYYTFEPNTYYGYFIQNQSLIKSYDATIYNITNFIDNTKSKFGLNCLYLTNSGYLGINNILTLTNTGLSVSLWSRTLTSKTNFTIFDFNFIKLSTNIFNNFTITINNVTISSNIQFLNNDTWNNVILTLDNLGICNLYINGSNLLTTNGTYYYPNTYTNLLVGNGYDGYIDDFRVYNRVLQNYEILMLYNSPCYSINNSNNNYILTAYQTTNTIVPKPINIFANKIYDGTNIAYTYTLSGLVNIEAVTLCGIIYYDNINAGNNFITICGTLYGADSYKYFIQNYYTVGIITTKILTPKFNFNKIYDTTLITNNVTYTLSGVLVQDIGTVDISTNYLSLYTNIYPTISGVVNVTNLSLYGSNNYTIIGSINSTGIITPKPYYIPSSSLTKIYDGTARINIPFSDTFSSDTIIGHYGFFNDKNVGSNKSINNITISGIIINTNTLTNTSIYYLAQITPTPVKNLLNSNNYTISGLTGNQTYLNGTYIFSGTTVYSVQNTYYNAFIDTTGNYYYHSNSVYVNGIYSGSYSTAIQNVGNINGEYIQVQVPFNIVISKYVIYTRSAAFIQRLPATFYLVGSTDGSTWILLDYRDINSNNLQSQMAFNVTNLIATGFNYIRLVVNKIGNDSYLNIGCIYFYGGIVINNTNNSIIINSSNNYIFTNIVNYQLDTFINQSNANYYYTPLLPFFGSILPTKLNYNFYGINKTYDGNNIANVNKTLDNIISDDVDLSYNSTFNDSTAGYNKLITVNNVQIIGLNSSNYYISYNSDYTFATIYQKQINIIFNSPIKAYDGNNSVTLTYTISGLINDDIGFVDICNNYIAYYSSIDKNTNIPIYVNSLTLYGIKSANYTPNIIPVYGSII